MQESRPSVVLIHRPFSNEPRPDRLPEETTKYELERAAERNPSILLCEAVPPTRIDELQARREGAEKPLWKLDASFPKRKPVEAIYRDGALTGEDYALFYKSCREHGLQLPNTPEQVNFVTSFAKVYPYLAPFTFKSVIFDPGYSVFEAAMMGKAEQFRTDLKELIAKQPWDKTLLRFDERSLKNVPYFNDPFKLAHEKGTRRPKLRARAVHNIIDRATMVDDIDGFTQVLANSLHYTYMYNFDFPLIVREYGEPTFITGTAKARNGRTKAVTVPNEYRTFAYKGNVVDVASYWSNRLALSDETRAHIRSKLEPVRQLSQAAVTALAEVPDMASFYTFDVLELADGSLKAVEVNEGQGSGIYSSALDDFYASFKPGS